MNEALLPCKGYLVVLSGSELHVLDIAPEDTGAGGLRKEGS